MFYRLFFHWSYNVRQSFHKLLLFQFEYFFVIKTCNMIGLNYEAESYFETEELFHKAQDHLEDLTAQYAKKNGSLSARLPGTH